jgi:hypothetical protein
MGGCLLVGRTVQFGRSVPVMVDPADALRDPVTSRAERGQIQRDWIAASAESGRQATEALGKAAEMLAGGIPGRRPDAEVARAWAEIGARLTRASHHLDGSAYTIVTCTVRPRNDRGLGLLPGAGKNEPWLS